MPNGWIVTTLGEAFTLQAGKTISSSDIHEKSASNQFPCFGGNGIRGYVDSYNRNGHYPIIGRQGALCGNINEAQGRFYATEHAVVVETYAGVNVDWVIMLLEAMNLNQYATATAQPGLSVATIKEVKFCLPPLKEQSRIVSELNKWLSAIKTLDSDTVSLAKTIFKTKSKILSLAISGKLVPQEPADEPAINLLKRINPDFVPCDNSHYPFELPNGWVISIFGVLNEHKSKSVNPMLEPEKKYELYSVPTFETGKPEFMRGGKIGSTKQAVSIGEVLVCKINPHLNRVWKVEHYDYELTCIASSEWIVFSSQALVPEFAVLYFQSQYFRDLMMSNVSGVGGSLMRARPSAVDRYPIPIPPIREQKRIVNMVLTLVDKITCLVSAI